MARGTRRVLCFLVFVTAVPVAPATATSSVDPQWPELLPLGGVEIAVGDRSYFQPVAGVTQVVTAYARPTQVSSDMKDRIPVSLSWVPPEGGCDRGGIEFAKKQHEQARWDEARQVYILRAGFTSDDIPRTRRFCWSTSSKTAKKYHVPKTGEQDIAFAGPLFGAHWESDLTRINLPNESYLENRKAGHYRLGYGATGDVIRRRHAVFPPCQGGSGFDSNREYTLRGSAWRNRGANTVNAFDFRVDTREGCGEQIDNDFRDAPTGRGLGNLHIDTNALQALEIPESQHAIGASCYLGNAERRSVDRATAIVEGVGCRVGRVLPFPTDPQFPKAVPGTVWAVASHGQRAVLAPRGTSVDLYVNVNSDAPLNRNPLPPPPLQMDEGFVCPSSPTPLGNGLDFTPDGGAHRFDYGGAKKCVSFFRFPPSPEHGRVRINFFIMQKVQGARGLPPAARLKIQGGGDGRGFDAQVDPSLNRAYAVLDYRSGRGAMVAYPSCTKYHEQCTDARRFSASIDGGQIWKRALIGNDHALNRLRVESKPGLVRLKYELVNSDRARTSPAVSGAIVLEQMAASTFKTPPYKGGDCFPSIAIYQDIFGVDGSVSATKLLYEKEQGRIGLVQLADPWPNCSSGTKDPW